MSAPRERIFTIPLLTSRGFVALGGLLLGPCVGLLFPIDWQEAIAVSALILLLLLVIAGSNVFAVRRFAQQALIESIVQPRVYTGTRCAITFNCQLPDAHFVRCSMRPEIPAGISVEHEVIEFDPSTETQSVEYVFTPLIRGDLRWKGATWRISPGLGLFSVQTYLSFEPELVTRVFPNAHCAPDSARQSFQRLSTGNATFSISGGEGREFDSLRQYAPGDDPRRIDWKRTARRGFPLVRLYRPETHQRINVLIDCSRRMSNVVDNRLQLDHAIDSAAYLARIATEQDDEVGLFAFHHSIVDRVPCRRGRQQYTLLMNRLRRLELGALEGDYDLVSQFGRDSRRRSLLVLLTSVSNPANLDAIRAALLPLAQKHVPLVVASYDRDLERLLRRSVNSQRGAYVAAAAVEQRNAIDHRLALLRRCGIECIYSDVADIPKALQLKYYELKLSGRL